MRRAALALASILVLAYPASVAESSTSLNELRFRPPAQLGTEISTSGSTWLLLVFSNETEAAATIDFPATATNMEYQEAIVDARDPTVGHVPFGVDGLPPSEQILRAPRLSLGFEKAEPGSVYLEADRIDWAIQDATAQLGIKPPTPASCLTTFVGDARNEDRSARFNWLCPPESVAMAADPANASPMPVSLQASGVRLIEWHNAEATCEGSSGSGCPGESVRQDEASSSASVTIRRRFLSFQRLIGEGGNISLEGATVFAYGGGSALDVAVTGYARLPLAEAPPACTACSSPDGQTLLATGSLAFLGVEQRDGWLATSLQGDLATLRFDEQAIDPSALFGLQAAAVAAGAVATVLLVKLLGGFFTRIVKGGLDNTRRRSILDAIQANPGITMRGLERLLGSTWSVLRYHVKVLARDGQIVRRKEGNTIRLFENHGRYGPEWRAWAVLRDPALQRLHALVLENPGMTRAGLVRHLRSNEWLWSRRSAYRRLARLVKVGLVEETSSGLRALGILPGPREAT